MDAACGYRCVLRRRNVLLRAVRHACNATHVSRQHRHKERQATLVGDHETACARTLQLPLLRSIAIGSAARGRSA